MIAYHLWFVTKYHKPIIAGRVENIVKDVFSEVARNKNYAILEMEANRDHIHLLVQASNKKDLTNMVRVLKCVSAKRVLEMLRSTPCLRTGNVRSFWANGYGHKIVYEPEIEAVKSYIRNQKRIPHT